MVAADSHGFPGQCVPDNGSTSAEGYQAIDKVSQTVSRQDQSVRIGTGIR